MISWIAEQAELNASQFDRSMEEYYPESQAYLRDPRTYFDRTCCQCNYLDAVKQIAWASYLRNGSTILDLGCGGGWLSAYLSTFDSIDKIVALDSSRYFVTKMLPAIADIMNSQPEKIEPVVGFFSPLLLEDATLDAVVASSVLHHAENLETVLKEIRRVLKKGGILYLLNETPFGGNHYTLSITKAFAKIFVNSLFRVYSAVSPTISSHGYLYDPSLGDRTFPLWYWKKAIEQSGFSLIECVDSGLPTVKGADGIHLTHFVCKAI